MLSSNISGARPLTSAWLLPLWVNFHLIRVETVCAGVVDRLDSESQGQSPAGRTEASLDIKEIKALRERVPLLLQNVLFPFSLVGITGSAGIFPLLLSTSTLWRCLPLTSEQLHLISVLLEQNQGPRVPTGSVY